MTEPVVIDVMVDDVLAVDVATDGFSLETGQVTDVVTVEVKGEPGESAYQLAVDGGFSGTQAQWLTSLEGADGAPYTPPGWQQVAFPHPPVNLFSGSQISWGTGGLGFYRWTRIGDTVLMKIYLSFGADADIPTGFSAFIFEGAVLPATPVLPTGNFGAAVPGGFGYLNIPPTTDADGGAYIVSPAIIQTPDATLAFIAAPSVTTMADSGSATLWGEGRPTTFSGRACSYQGSLEYECS